MAQYEDEHVFRGELKSGSLLWTGSGRADISSATITVADEVYKLDKTELRTPIADDKFTSFVLWPDEVEKVAFEEARRLTSTDSK